MTAPAAPDALPLDLGIVQVHLDLAAGAPATPTRTYWASRLMDAAPWPRNAFTETRLAIEANPLKDHLAFATQVAQVKIEAKGAEGAKMNVPHEVDDQMQAVCPQFFLRNISRLQRDIDVQRPMAFDIEEKLKPQAEADLDEVRAAKLPRTEFVDVWTAALLDDLRIFWEEVLYMCPWEQMPRQLKAPDDDSPWSPNHSRATLTYELMDRRKSVFVYGHKNIPIAMRREPEKRLAKTRAIKQDAPPAGLDGGSDGVMG